MGTNVLEPDNRTIDDVISGEDEANVLVISDDPIYNRVANEIFATSTLTPKTKSKEEARQITKEPYIIIVDMYNGGPLDDSLSFMEEMGSRFPKAALFGTLDQDGYSRMFGTERVYAYSARWSRLRNQRTASNTNIYKIDYPSPDIRVRKDVEKDIEYVFHEGLTQLLNSSLGTTIRTIHEGIERKKDTDKSLSAYEVFLSLMQRFRGGYR